MNSSLSDFPATGRVGERLAAARQAQGLELAEIASRTKVPARQLEAIEAGRNDQLPAIPYAVGFVRSYARVLQLDAESLVRDFRAELGREPAPDRYAPASFEPADPARVPPRLLVLVTLAIALILGLTYVAFRSGTFSGDGPDDRTALAAADEPAEIAPAPRAGVLPIATGGAVVLTATAPVWLRVYEADGGGKLLEKEMEANESWTVPPTAVAPQILTGRPQAVRVTVGGRVIPPLGEPERRIRDVSLKPADLLARLAAAPASAAAPAPDQAPPQGQAREVPPFFRNASPPDNASGL